jgi:hypothetical protein
MSRILRGEKPAELSVRESAAIIGGSLDDTHGRAEKMPEEPWLRSSLLPPSRLPAARKRRS